MLLDYQRFRGHEPTAHHSPAPVLPKKFVWNHSLTQTATKTRLHVVHQPLCVYLLSVSFLTYVNIIYLWFFSTITHNHRMDWQADRRTLMTMTWFLSNELRLYVNYLCIHVYPLKSGALISGLSSVRYLCNRSHEITPDVQGYFGEKHDLSFLIYINQSKAFRPVVIWTKGIKT